MPLERFCTGKSKELEFLHKQEKMGLLPPPLKAKRPAFGLALLKAQEATLPIIAEYKRASPSRGVINTAMGPEEAAAQYRDAGACCISVLTEKQYFQGDMDFIPRMAALPRMVPLLRKDFIFDPLQVRATAATPAAALLLMVRLTPNPRQLQDLRELAESLGLEAVVEVFDPQELRTARDSGAHIIQVNARNLSTLTVDRAPALRLAAQQRHKGGHEIWIAASGVENAAHVREAQEAGFDAVLVGTSLMRDGQPGAALRFLRQTSEADAPCPAC